MKTILSRLFVILACFIPVTAGCTPTFWQTAVATVATFSSSVLNWLGLATSVFQAIKVLLPTDKQPSAQDQFDRAVVATRHALAILNDAVDAAVQASDGKFDATRLRADVVDAIQQVSGLLDQFTSNKSAVGGLVGTHEIVGMNDLYTLQASIQRQAKE